MPKTYEPQEIEPKLVETWLAESCYQRSKGEQDFTVVIPPPNVTGALHMGHALNNTILDTIVRRARMQGLSTRWIVGTDHAGIATQTKVDQLLKSQGINRREIGREAFLEHCQAWKNQYGATIVNQFKRVGCSCDYDNERFTMDELYTNAVRKTFVDWYHDGLIYHGERIVNWCPDCTTAIADDEVEHEERAGHLWHIKYPLKEPVGDIDHIVIATTRPETLLGDTGVAINPQDERYQGLAGATVVLPLVGREIPIITDFYVDASFGTGCVKVTPAHDPNDWAMGERHNLEVINIFDEHAVVNEKGGAYQGLNRHEARERVVADLEAQGFLVSVEDHEHSVGCCYRCHNTLEPWLSDQWFVDVSKLKEKASEVVRNGDITFYPGRWKDSYLDWMDNLKDWCISRQLWWGHRIPVFTCPDCGWEDASMEDLTTCPQCGKPLKQDPDVLDTWFSSQLWTFATQGWPEDPSQMIGHHPTAVLSTAPDIIALWVARMVMASEYFLDEVPFHDVLIHPTVLAADGSRMSKSKGNGINPLDLIEKYGADAMRFCLLLQVTGGQAIKFNEAQTMPAARAFVTKVFNASRFVMMHLEQANEEAQAAGEPLIAMPAAPTTTHAEDAWILSRLAKTAALINESMKTYELGEMSRALYSFFWNEFCDWYVELAKPRLAQGGEARREVLGNLLFVLDTALHLLHPAMPFVTEYIWGHLPHHEGAASRLMLDAWPDQAVFEQYQDAEAERAFELITSVASAVRSTRARYQISPKKPLAVKLRASQADQELVTEHAASLTGLVLVDDLDFLADKTERPKASSLTVTELLEIFVLLEGIVDLDAEKVRLEKEKAKVEKDFMRFDKKLSNPGFLAKAAPEIIEKDRRAHQELAKQLELLTEQLKALA